MPSIDFFGTKYSLDDLTVKMAQDALFAQSACNIVALVGSFAEILKDLRKMPNYAGSCWEDRHPVTVMFMAQLNHLNGRGAYPHMSEHMRAWDLCSEKLKEAEGVNKANEVK